MRLCLRSRIMMSVEGNQLIKAKKVFVALVAVLAIGSITYTSINKTRVFMHSSFLFIIDTQYGDF